LLFFDSAKLQRFCELNINYRFIKSINIKDLKLTVLLSEFCDIDVPINNITNASVSKYYSNFKQLINIIIEQSQDF